MISKDSKGGVIVRILDDGPIHVVGDFDILDADGQRFPKHGLFSFCRCGLSERKPYCDGAHREARFSNRFRAPEVATKTGNEAG